MIPLIHISFRNFLRQRQRNLLLGIAIAFGVMVLTVAHAFSRGISDNLLNRVVIYMTGHVRVNMMENGRYMTPIIRNPDLLDRIKQSVSDIQDVQDDVSVYARAIGIGKSDYIYVVGTLLNPEFKGQFNLISGDYALFESPQTLNPVLLSENKAKALNVKVGDAIGLRVINVNGQNETAVLTVAGILKSQNVFMDYAVFIPTPRLKHIMGYHPWESGAIKLIVRHPKQAKQYADAIHAALTPKPAYWVGRGQATPNTPLVDVTVIGLTQHPSPTALKSVFGIDSSQPLPAGAIISHPLARQLNVHVGDTLTLTYPQRFIPQLATYAVPISAIGTPNSQYLSDHVVFISNDLFFSQFNHYFPKLPQNVTFPPGILDPHHPLLHSLIAGQWILLERSRTPKSITDEMKALMQYKQNQPVISVSSMYEAASEIVKIEQVFNMATFIAGAILFGVIMIGVLNSLRMTIRERTQEIGTLRAIGMKAKEVQFMFLLEVLFLTVTGWILGLIASFVVIKGLSMIPFSADNPFNMMMVDRHLYFVPTITDTLKNGLLLFVFALVTAYFPARSAAKLPPAEAFRHIT